MDYEQAQYRNELHRVLDLISEMRELIGGLVSSEFCPHYKINNDSWRCVNCSAQMVEQTLTTGGAVGWALTYRCDDSCSEPHCHEGDFVYMGGGL